MFRFSRHLVTIAAAASLVVFFVIAALWLRSYSHSDNVTSRRPDGQQDLRLREGHLVLNLYRVDWSKEPAGFFGMKYEDDKPAPASTDLLVRFFICPDPASTEVFWDHAGFTWYEYRRSDGIGNITAIAPFWSLALVSAILPLFCTTMRVRSHRRLRNTRIEGFCSVCGYDLRATPCRCPECGAVATSP